MVRGGRAGTRTHLAVAPEIDVRPEVGEGGDVVCNIVYLWGLEWPMPRVPMGARIGWRRLLADHGRKSCVRFPFVTLEGYSQMAGASGEAEGAHPVPEEVM